MAYAAPSHLVYLILSPIISTLLAFVNMITVYVFCRHFRLASLSLIIIVNICACDIFVCLFSNTFYVANLWHPTYAWTTGAVSCKIFKFLTMLMNIAQIYLLCFLNADLLRRLVSATSRQWRKTHGIVFCCISWGAACVICIPRLFMFDEKVFTTFDPKSNASVVLNYNCKAVGMNQRATVSMTIMTFILAYVLPACFIVYTLLHSQLFMWNRRMKIHMICTKNAVTKMSHQLALTFNLTAALFMLIWTPFFILSIVDIQTDFINSKHHANTNFSLRCTLLIFGSAKPLIYIMCITRFRRSLRCGFQPEDENTTRADPSSTVSQLKTTSLNHTINSPITMPSLPDVSSA